ncbi:MAG: hypothetical protein QFB87_01505 [Patescibacteria group bacterium]|nr:hypothetical protein [Patescibacteria group bacterium]
MSIIRFLLAVAAVFSLLVASELYWRTHKQHGELSRKFIHITVGSFVAVWPFFLSWGQIQILSLAFLLVVSASKYLKIFQAIHSVQRPTWGELFFSAAVGLTTLATQNKYLFAAALLQMSLADGLAAIIGTRYGKGNQYFIGGHAKSLAGTATFVVVSLGILLIYGLTAGVTLQPYVLLTIAFSTAALENVGLFGFDNLLVPVFVAVALKAY